MKHCNTFAKHKKDKSLSKTVILCRTTVSQSIPSLTRAASLHRGLFEICALRHVHASCCKKNSRNYHVLAPVYSKMSSLDSQF